MKRIRDSLFLRCASFGSQLWALRHSLRPLDLSHWLNGSNHWIRLVAVHSTDQSNIHPILSLCTLSTASVNDPVSLMPNAINSHQDTRLNSYFSCNVTMPFVNNTRSVRISTRNIVTFIINLYIVSSCIKQCLSFSINVYSSTVITIVQFYTILTIY